MKDHEPNAARPPSYLEPYRDAVDRHGAVFEATLWASRDHQMARFRVLSEMVDFRGSLIIDAGAGLGDLAAYLHEHAVLYERYIGVEGVPEILASAGRRCLPRAEFVSADFLRDAGCFEEALSRGTGLRPIIVFCGSLNTMRESDARRALERAWRALPLDRDGALAFNFLSGACCPFLRSGSSYPARRFSPQHMADWAIAHSPRIAMRSDYFPGGHDATIVVRKDPPEHAGRR